MVVKAQHCRTFATKRSALCCAIAASITTISAVDLPAFAQHHSSRTQASQKALPPQASPNQMMNMLDQVETGKSPILPARPQQAAVHGASSRAMPPMRVAPPQARGMSRAPMRPMMGHGMALGALGGGAGMAMLHNGAAGGGGGQSQFIQNLAQKISAMRQGGGAGGGGEAQFLQQMMQGGAAQGASGQAGSAMSAPGGGMGMGMPPMSAGGMGMGSSEIIRPGSGMGKGAAPVAQQKAPLQHLAPGSLLRGASATARGAGSSSAGGTPSASDLERQMEQQYGR